MWVVMTFLMCAPWHGECVMASPEHEIFTLAPETSQVNCRVQAHDWVMEKQREMGYSWPFDIECERAI